MKPLAQSATVWRIVLAPCILIKMMKHYVVNYQLVWLILLGLDAEDIYKRHRRYFLL